MSDESERVNLFGRVMRAECAAGLCRAAASVGLSKPLAHMSCQAKNKNTFENRDALRQYGRRKRREEAQEIQNQRHSEHALSQCCLLCAVCCVTAAVRWRSLPTLVKCMLVFVVVRLCLPMPCLLVVACKEKILA